MISRNEFDAYNKAVDQIGNKAASDVESSVLNWCTQNPAASVAEKREAAKLIMEGYVQGYDDIASEFAAEWYDHRAKSEGISLDQAITMAVYSPEKSDAVARYQAKKLVKGGDAAFAKACGEYARNDAFRSLNETIIANVGRDKAKGVRFARVTTGRETCTFCLMLASRGAVYHTRRTAGEFKSFHRGCDCKVVPGFDDDPMAVLVEGFDPMAAYDMWQRVERATVYERDLYKMTIAEIAQEADEINAKVGPLFREQKRKGDYYGIFEPFVSSFGSKGTISPQYWAKPAGKEIQLASWLTAKGHDVEFLTPSCEEGDHTPDIRLDGELWEIKRLTTRLPGKARERISDALNQSDSVIVDLSVNEHDADALEAAAVGMLDDPRARRILVVKDGKAVLYKK